MKSLLLVTTVSATMLIGSSAWGEPAASLVTGFQNPPASAKPRVWWHWIDGNVSEDGIRRDLTWLNEVGIGGVQNFDAALADMSGKTVPWADERVAYLTPRWRQLFRFAVHEAHQRGMEFAIAASPGWSESGGPWVKPRQGMKKLVWSETIVQGGKRLAAPLPAPPQVTGPFQNLPFAAAPFAVNAELPQYYADVAVVAYRASAADEPAFSAPAAVTSSAGAIDAGRLSDGDLAQGVSLPFGEASTSWLQYAFPKAQRIQAVTVAVTRPSGIAPSDMATGGAVWLEVSDDGQTFRRVIDVPRNGAPQQTLSFPPVTARAFRLVLERPNPQPSAIEQILDLPPAPPPTALTVLEYVLHTAPRVHRFEDKAGFTNRAIVEADDSPAISAPEAIVREAVIDLTGKMRGDGTLDWAPPRGRWVVLRFGYSLTGRTNHPASREGTGLEVDKLNRDHVKAYFEDYLAEYAQTLDPRLIGKQGLQYLLTDSYEAGIANWTDDMFSQFQQRRGYDARPWLPVLAGHVVGSFAESDRFLWDFRQTLSDLIAEAHYGQLSELLHAKGMGRYGESHESGRAFIGDGMQVKKSADVPMGALWAAAPWESGESYNMDIRESASVAHIYGQNLVAAESLTAFGQTFAFTPETLKVHADRELAMGLNRFVIHTSVHQPDNRLGPGVTLGPFGQWFTRHETWAAQARPWISYLARSSYLLQQGQFVADIAYLYGEGNNITNLFGGKPPVIPTGFNFDFVNADALIHVLSMKDGKLTTPSGMQYRVLALDESTRRMSLPVLRKIRALVAQGATVIGSRPTITPSLADDQAEFNAIADELWNGKVRTGALADVLRTLSIAPDCLFSGSQDRSDLRYVHRAVDESDLYFVASGHAEARTIDVSFRVTGKAPEIWRADTGEMSPASFRVENGRTVVPLNLQPHDAVFVVFRQTTAETRRVIPEPAEQVIASVQGPWDVSFPPDHGAPARAHFATLASWTDNTDAGIKYFSGTATYATRLTAKKAWLTQGARIHLNLGDVQNLAEVSLNGRSLGELWKRPFVIDITDALHAGENQLEVKVTNVWPNRMIGDKQPGAQRIAYATYDPFKADSPLLPSGLLGPVTVSRITPHE